MPQNRYAPLYSLTRRIGSTRPGAWFFAHALHHLDRLTLKLTGGRATLTSALGGVPVVFVTTVGVKSGLPRTVPLLSIRDPQDPATFALVASNWGQRHYPAWYHNLTANPRATCTLQGVSREYIAHEASGEEYERFWQLAVDTYIGYSFYKQRVGKRRIPIVVMTPLQRHPQ